MRKQKQVGSLHETMQTDMDARSRTMPGFQEEKSGTNEKSHINTRCQSLIWLFPLQGGICRIRSRRRTPYISLPIRHFASPVTSIQSCSFGRWKR
ncbi:MAG: hypothetical protein ACFNZ2_00030 [Prevotella histicola]